MGSACKSCVLKAEHSLMGKSRPAPSCPERWQRRGLGCRPTGLFKKANFSQAVVFRVRPVLARGCGSGAGVGPTRAWRELDFQTSTSWESLRRGLRTGAVSAPSGQRRRCTPEKAIPGLQAVSQSCHPQGPQLAVLPSVTRAQLPPSPAG